MSAHVMAAASTGYNFDWTAFKNYLIHPGPLITSGVKYTIGIAIAAEILGILVGVIAALGRRSTFIGFRVLSGLYIWIFRGTPFLVQAAIVYFAGFPFFGLAIFGHYKWGPLDIFGVTLTGSVLAGTFALAVNEGAYMAEIIRSGIASVDPGQMEAAQAIGMTRRKAMRRVVLPQAVRIVIPPLGNQFNLMLKSTSLLSIISVSELYTAATVIQGQTFQPFEVYTAVAIYYLAMTTVWGGIQWLIERRVGRGYARTPSGSNRMLGRRWLRGSVS
jgi:polar amino acid transport system permease protein